MGTSHCSDVFAIFSDVLIMCPCPTFAFDCHLVLWMLGSTCHSVAVFFCCICIIVRGHASVSTSPVGQWPHTLSSVGIWDGLCRPLSSLWSPSLCSSRIWLCFVSLTVKKYSACIHGLEPGSNWVCREFRLDLSSVPDQHLYSIHLFYSILLLFTILYYSLSMAVIFSIFHHVLLYVLFWSITFCYVLLFDYNCLSFFLFYQITFFYLALFHYPLLSVSFCSIALYTLHSLERSVLLYFSLDYHLCLLSILFYSILVLSFLFYCIYLSDYVLIFSNELLYILSDYSLLFSISIISLSILFYFII